MQEPVRKYDVEKIFDVVVAFNREQDPVKLLNIILDKMMEITDSDAGTLYMVEDGALHFRIVKNNTLGSYQSAEEKIDLPPVVLDKDNIVNVCAYSAIKNEIVSIDDVYASDRFNFSGPKKYDKLTGYRSVSFLNIPLTATLGSGNEVLGVIQLINATDPATGQIVPYGDVYDPPILPALSNIAANTLANIMYREEIHQLFNSFVAVMTQAIDERSPYNRHHTQNVSTYCAAFAVYLSVRFPPGHPYYFDGDHLDQLRMAARLHDIGKIITPLEIMDKADRLGAKLKEIRYRFQLKKHQLDIALLKNEMDEETHRSETDSAAAALSQIETANTAGFLPDERIAALKELSAITYADSAGQNVPLLDEADIESITIQKGTLTAGERAVMQDHVSLTGRLLDKMTFQKYYREVPRWARGHHEFLDGTGYPQGLSGDELSIEMCIITIMDIFDALIATDRPYKKGMPLDRAHKILRDMAAEGKLHKELVELFIESKVWEVDNGA